jgi:ribosomal protein L37AE/L43A
MFLTILFTATLIFSLVSLLTLLFHSDNNYKCPKCNSSQVARHGDNCKHCGTSLGWTDLLSDSQKSFEHVARLINSENKLKD